MIIKTEGIVLSQRKYRESDKFLTILTREHGVIEAKLRQYGQIKRTIFNSICPLGYFHFDIFLNKQQYMINTAEKIEDFFALRYDVEKLALAGYFCELTQLLAPPRDDAWVYLRLLLNTLSLLASDKRSPKFLKAVYELRTLSIGGFMPNLVCCKRCCEFEGKRMYFMPLSGVLICSHCIANDLAQGVVNIPLSPAVLAAMRYIVYKEDDQLFNFSLDPKLLKQLGQITEYYMLTRIEKPFKSLTLYNQLVT